MKYVNWFEHEIGSLDDPKLQELFRIHGLEGLGCYWILVELMYKAGGKLLREDIPEYAFMLRITDEKLQMLIKCKAFERDCTHFWTSGVEKRIQKRKEIGTKRSFAVSQRKDRKEAMLYEIEENSTNVIQNSTIVGKKENTIQKEKQKRNNVFIKPTIEQVIEYCKEKAPSVDAHHYFNSREANGWKMQNGQPIISWKHHILTWERINNKNGAKNESQRRMLN